MIMGVFEMGTWTSFNRRNKTPIVIPDPLSFVVEVFRGLGAEERGQGTKRGMLRVVFVGNYSPSPTLLHSFTPPSTSSLALRYPNQDCFGIDSGKKTVVLGAVN
jgi:hypothetical protein